MVRTDTDADGHERAAPDVRRRLFEPHRKRQLVHGKATQNEARHRLSAIVVRVFDAVRPAERGQTIPEAVFFLPIVLFALFGTIYVSQFWVVAERTQLAVRFGSPATDPATLYSVANIYSAATNLNLATCTAAPVTVLWDGAPLPGPTSAPYWLPAATSDSPKSTCQANYSKNQGAQFLALYVASTLQMVKTRVNVPDFLVKFAGFTGPSDLMTATESFAPPSDPSPI